MKTTFSFKASVSEKLKSNLLGGVQTDSALEKYLLDHQTKHFQADLQRVASAIGCTYREVTKNSIHYITTDSIRNEGCMHKLFSSLAILIMHSMMAKEGFQRMTDLLDGGESVKQAFLELVPGAEQDISSYLMRQICFDCSSDLLIYPTRKESEFKWIEETQKNLYGVDAVPRKNYQDWYSANSSGFFVFYFKDKIIGHLTLLPFKEDAFLPYEKGLIRETDLTGKDIWKEEERSKINLLYVESYILSGVHSDLTTLKIRTKFLEMANEVANLDSLAKGVYAMNATDDGMNAIKNMGMIEVKAANGTRTDGHTMNVASIDVIRTKLNSVNAKLVAATSRKMISRLDKIIKKADLLRIVSNYEQEIKECYEQIIDLTRGINPCRTQLVLKLEALDSLLKKQNGITPKLLQSPPIAAYLSDLNGCDCHQE